MGTKWLRGATPRGIVISFVLMSAPCALMAAENVPAATVRAPLIEAAAATAQTGTFQRLEDVLQHAYVHSPTLRAARAELRVRDELLPQAQSGWLPTVDANGEISKTWLHDVDGPDGTLSKEVGAGFSQPLYRGGRTISSTKSAMGRIEAQRALLSSIEQGILLDVAAVYMDVFRGEALLELTRKNHAMIEQQLTASRERFNAGEATRTDVAQSQARLARARADITAADGQLQKSRARYEELTGMRAGSLGYPRLNLPLPASASAAMDQAETQSPLVQAGTWFHEAAQADIDTIFGELLPRLSFTGNHVRYIDPQPGRVDDYAASEIALVASIPLYEGGGTRSRVRAAKHTANQRFLEILESRLNVREDAAAAWADLAAARADIASRQIQVNAAAIAREGVQQETLLGVRTILDSLNADQEYLEAQVALITAQRNEIVAQFSLLAAIGGMTPESLGFGGLAHDTDAHLREVDWKMLGMDVEIDNGGT